MLFQKRWTALAVAAALAGCAVGPRYEGAPAMENMPAAFKEAGADWVPAQPQDAADRGPWWQVFQDPQLSDLVARVEVSNQNVAAAVASYQQARALVAQQRAGLFPSLSLSAGANRNGTAGGGSNNSSVSSSSTTTSSGTGVTVSSG